VRSPRTAHDQEAADDSGALARQRRLGVSRRRAYNRLRWSITNSSPVPPNGATPEGSGNEASFPSRLLGTGARGAGRVARATGVGDTVEALAEEAIVRAIESRATERALTRVIQGPALEDAVEQALRSPAVERALNRAIESEMTERVWDRLLDSDEVQKLIERIAEAPEVRAAIAAPGVGFLDDLGREVARGAHRLDDGAERVARRLLRRQQREGRVEEAGLVSRGLGFLLDLAILDIAVLTISAVVAFVVSLFVSGDPPAAPVIAVGATFWLLAGSAYLLTFWALAGQTPGMRVLRIHLDAAGERRIGARRAIRRLGGAVLSVVALGLGFLAVLFEDRRRGWLDRIAGTEVLYAAASPKRSPSSSSDSDPELPRPPERGARSDAAGPSS
jgi:uncharacterized RDD family membrane protein YckC